jgi:hypothetical protein
MSEWLATFERAGFILEEQLAEKTRIDSLRVNQRFAGYDQQDLACTILTLVFRRAV